MRRLSRRRTTHYPATSDIESHEGQTSTTGSGGRQLVLHHGTSIRYTNIWGNVVCMKMARRWSTSHVNSEFHGVRFTCGREERRVGVLGWDFHDGLFDCQSGGWKAFLYKSSTCLSAQVGECMCSITCLHLF